ncbi:hypothetical protein CSB85_3693 [Pseudomonas aeruginosa]|nr:hypothetical protein CSB85_3693 [Pseudomonas aeruginosa]
MTLHRLPRARRRGEAWALYGWPLQGLDHAGETGHSTREG